MGFDFLFNRYMGLSIVAHKRWSNNWQMLASWDIGRARGTFDARRCRRRRQHTR